jgi:thiol-disulfide isomerase/thioredoxin
MLAADRPVPRLANVNSFRLSGFVAGLLLVCRALGAEAGYPPLPLGSPAVDFDLPGVDGKRYSLKSFAEAKVLALVFTSNHCPTAQAYEERLKQLVQDYAGKGVAVVAINPNSPAAVRPDELGYTDLGDSFGEMVLRAQNRAYNFAYLDDGATQATSKRYGPVATPHVFVFDQARKLRFSGRIDDNERLELVKVRDLRNALDALLAGQEPPVKETKVFGCSTKWNDKLASGQQWLEKVRREPVTVTIADEAALRELRANQGSGKVRLINVWATWCGPCIAEFDDLIDTNLRFRNRDFELVTLAAQFPDEQPKVLGFLKKHHASTRNLIFGTTDKYKLMEALDPDWNGALPHTLLLGPDGKVLYRQSGELNFLELRRKIVPALNAISPWKG